MKCEEVRRLSESYVDGELELTRQLELVEHLAGCSACKADVDEATHFDSLIRNAMPVYKAPPALTAKVRATLRKERTPRYILEFPTFNSWVYAATALIIG